jgi:hypothetical protein
LTAAEETHSVEQPVNPPADNTEELKATEEAEFAEQPVNAGPGPYNDLQRVLRQLTVENGAPRQLRSRVGHLLFNNPLIYERPGGHTFRRYIQGAVEAGIVTIGGVTGDAWVELTEAFR